MNATSILLEPLAGDEASTLVDNLLGDADLPVAARDRILEAAEGNPLFVEEMLGMLIDDGLLRFEDGVVARRSTTSPTSPCRRRSSCCSPRGWIGSTPRSAP